MLYRYEPIAQIMLSHYPYLWFRLQDHHTEQQIKKSPWEIISDIDLITKIHPKYYPMICAAAADYWDKDKRRRIKNISNKDTVF